VSGFINRKFDEKVSVVTEENMRRLFAPGCALKKHRPESVLKITQYLMEKGYADGIYLTCCKDGMHIDDDIQFINCCPGCNNHFNEISQRYSTVSLWSVLKDSDVEGTKAHFIYARKMGKKY
jgi:hypothetical protein